MNATPRTVTLTVRDWRAVRSSLNADRLEAERLGAAVMAAEYERILLDIAKQIREQGET